MTNESARGKRVVGKSGAGGKGGSKVKAGSSAKRSAKAVGRPASKQAKKATNGAKPTPAYAADHGQMTAFHHMQRASVVMSLMEKGTGKDLRALLERGVKLYR